MIIKARPGRLLKAFEGHAGLGDTVAAVAEKTGIAALVKCHEKRTGKPCRCPKRRAWLNRVLPYKMDAGG